MRDGPFLIGLPSHVQNPTSSGPSSPLDPIMVDLDLDLK
jgi:hypothetical protein